MKRILISMFTLLAAIPALAASDTGMPGMKMPPDAADGDVMNMKMTLPPMPAIYAGQPEKQGAPYMKPPPYMAYPPFLEPHWRYEAFEPQKYYRGFHFWLDQF